MTDNCEEAWLKLLLLTKSGDYKRFQELQNPLPLTVDSTSALCSPVHIIALSEPTTCSKKRLQMAKKIIELRLHCNADVESVN